MILKVLWCVRVPEALLLLMEQNETGQHNITSLGSSLAIWNDRTKKWFFTYKNLVEQIIQVKKKNFETGHFSDTGSHSLPNWLVLLLNLGVLGGNGGVGPELNHRHPCQIVLLKWYRPPKAVCYIKYLTKTIHFCQFVYLFDNFSKSRWRGLKVNLHQFCWLAFLVVPIHMNVSFHLVWPV